MGGWPPTVALFAIPAVTRGNKETNTVSKKFHTMYRPTAQTTDTLSKVMAQPPSAAPLCLYSALPVLPVLCACPALHFPSPLCSASRDPRAFPTRIACQWAIAWSDGSGILEKRHPLFARPVHVFVRWFSSSAAVFLTSQTLAQAPLLGVQQQLEPTQLRRECSSHGGTTRVYASCVCIHARLHVPCMCVCSLSSKAIS